MAKVRTFVSLRVPEDDGILHLLDDLSSVRGIRTVRREQIHLTLLFLGDTDERDVRGLIDSLRISMRSFAPFDIAMRGTGAFPDMKRPRVFWIGADGGTALYDVADAVRRSADGLGLGYDRKPFRPHVTLGRISGRADISCMISDREFCTFRCSEILVMGSELGDGGAKHTVLGRIPLG